ncbi:hypothetical protein SDJN02_25573 [Cucurbita argyrosperma subsp. argyrosperma]|nr:hypothetical protein SDJN02_25573 [Cucurbita argyrosperma subsp. argyrosperma]
MHLHCMIIVPNDGVIMVLQAGIKPQKEQFMNQYWFTPGFSIGHCYGPQEVRSCLYLGRDEPPEIVKDRNCYFGVSSFARDAIAGFEKERV